MGMEGPLVDKEGFPRADIDVHTVRHARQRIACLQTDHSLLMKEIEEELYKIHAEIRATKDSGEVPVEVADTPDQSTPSAAPFAKVDRVDAGSPAAIAGLEVEDEVVEFGSVSSSNFHNIQQIGELVHNSVGRPVRVKVLRKKMKVTLSLTPGPWSGRGNLGCNIILIKR